MDFIKTIKIKSVLPFLLLILLSAASYHVVVSFTTVVYGDWYFSFKNAMKDYLFPLTVDQSGPNVVLWKLFYYYLYGIFGYFGFGSNVAEKFIVFWPIIVLTPISSYLLVRKLTKSAIAAFIGSLIFAYNTYFLSINTEGHELLPLAFVFGTFAFLTFINLLETKKKLWIPITVLLLFISGFYDLRSLYIIVCVLTFYALYFQLFIEKSWNKNLSINALNVCIVFISFFILNSYWILPMLVMHSLTNNDILSREIFGDQFYNLQSSITLFYPFWTGARPTWFLVQPIPLYFWLYPILAFTGFVVRRKNKQVLFFGTLGLIGIFLSKQVAPPLTQVYPWLYTHIPGFAAFREASKFDFLIVLSYTVLISAFVTFIINTFHKKQKLMYLLLFFIAILPFWNAIPYITGSIQNLFAPIAVPADYEKLDNYFASDRSYGKILELNYDFHWYFSTNTHPQIDALSSVDTIWKGIIPYNHASQESDGKKLVNFIASPEGRKVLTSSSFGYIVVFLNNSLTNNNRSLGETKDFYETSFSKIHYLQKENIGLQDVLLYKINDYAPHVYATNALPSITKNVPVQRIAFTTDNPTEYKVHVEHLTKPTYVQFTEQYQPQWNLFFGNFTWYDVFFNKNNQLPSAMHRQDALALNTFVLDPNYIKQHFPKGTYILNKDGSITTDVTIYLSSQSYLYIGLLVSGIIFVGLVSSLFYFYKKEKKQ